MPDQTRRIAILDPFSVFELSRNTLLTPQKLMPSARMFESFSEAARSVSQANVNYWQALMRANAILLGAMLDRPSPPSEGREERPSVATKKADPPLRDAVQSSAERAS